MKIRLSILLVALLVTGQTKAAPPMVSPPQDPMSLDSGEVQMYCGYPSDPSRIDRHCADVVRTQRLNRLVENLLSKEQQHDAALAPITPDQIQK